MLYDQPLIKRSDGLQRFWFSTDAPDYFPLVSTLLWVQWRLWGMNPTGYHVVNALLHAGAVLLLWRVLLRLCVPWAWFAALLFAVHPVCVETVAWITETKNTLPMVLALASLLAFLRFEDTQSRRWYTASVGLFAFALLGKTSVVMLPVTLLIIAWWNRGKVSRTDFVRSAPFFLLSLIFGVITIWFQSHRAIIHTEIRTDSIASRAAVAGAAVWFYLVKAIFPLQLSFVYPRWQINMMNPLAWLPGVALLASLAALWFQRNRFGRGPTAALLVYILNLLPVLGFVNIYFMRYSLVADHWQYVALPAVIALVVAAAHHIVSKAPHLLPHAKILAVAAIVLFAGRSIAHQLNFRNNEALFLHVLRMNPDAWIAHNNLGLIRLQQRRYDEALQYLAKASALNPKLMDAHLNIGNVHAARTEHEKALEAYSRALVIQEDHRVYAAMGDVFAAQDKLAEAEAHYRSAIARRPDYVPAHTGLGRVLGRQQKFAQSAEAFARAVQLQPAEPLLRNLLAEALFRAGRRDEAIAELETTIRLFPNYKAARDNLGALTKLKAAR